MRRNKIRVLLAEDYRKFGEFLHELLTNEGHSVTYVATGKAALSMLDDYEFDAVVSDYELEHNGPNGVGILSYAQQKNPMILTILFSGVDRTREAKTAGVVPDHILTKDNIKGLVDTLVL